MRGGTSVNLRVSARGTHLLHEVEDAVQQLRDEGLHSIYVPFIKCVDEVAQGHNSVHPDLQPGETDGDVQTAVPARPSCLGGACGLHEAWQAQCLAFLCFRSLTRMGSATQHLPEAAG